MIRLKHIRGLAAARRDPSRALTSDLVVPCPSGLSYDPYQIAGIEYSSLRQNSLNGDDPGSGKTIQAIGLCNLLLDIRRVLIICPGFLKPHWRREFLKWDIKGLSVGIAEGIHGTFPGTDVCIVNYEILKAYRAPLRAQPWDLMIIDEVHKLKSKKADRTRETWGGIRRDSSTKKIVERVSPIPCKRQLCLTGTPTLNGKPKELWNLIQVMDPTGLGADWFTYAKRYCSLQEITGFEFVNGQRKETHVGWMWDGCENEQELQEYMRAKFMIRRLKADIMPQLKPKRRMIVPIQPGKALRKVLDKQMKEYDAYAKGREELLLETDFGGFSTKMLEVGLVMVDPCIEIAESDLEEYNKIVIACYHKEVAQKIADAFGSKSLLITGEVPAKTRQAIVDWFQTDPGFTVLVCTIGAGGVGFTMTASKLMIFPERSFVPGDVTQMEDRIHRRGQTEQVMYKHLVMEGSLSERQVQMLVAKQERADNLLDKKKEI